MNNAIPICRSILKHWIYEDAEYLKVWLTMLSNASYTQEDRAGVFQGVHYTLKYGEFIFGRKAWSEKLHISEQRLRHLIELLTADGMIDKIRFASKFTIYNIRNYHKFNQQEKPVDQPLEEDDLQQKPNRNPTDNH